MFVPPLGVRRALLPLLLALLAVAIVVMVAGAAIGLVVAPFGQRRPLLRLASFGLAYLVMEVWVLAATGALWSKRLAMRLTGRHVPPDLWTKAHTELLGRAVGWVLEAARRYLGFTVEVETAGFDPAASTQPLLALARHGGPGDSFVLVHLLVVRYQRTVKIVLKDILQLDPALDIVLNRLNCCFLPQSTRSDEDLTLRLAELVRTLEPGHALLLFPEGGNWTPNRRRRAIRHLARSGKIEAARGAALMTHVLPARPGGVLACLRTRRDLDVAIVAHAGLDRVVSARQVWNRLPLRTPMSVQIWPASPVPDTEEEREAWLTTEWAVVDEWIDAFRFTHL